MKHPLSPRASAALKCVALDLAEINAAFVAAGATVRRFGAVLSAHLESVDLDAAAGELRFDDGDVSG